MCFIPLSCPGKRFKGFHPSTLTSSEPQTLPDPDLSVIHQAKTIVSCIEKVAHGSKSQIMMTASSLPLASHRPECAHRTTSTGPVCMLSVQRDFGGRPFSSLVLFKMGLVDQIRTFASRPPVAIRELSG